MRGSSDLDAREAKGALHGLPIAVKDMADVAGWTQLTYYIIVLLPCALFAAIELLMPIGAGAETDWEKHYFSIRPWFFGVLITFQTVATLASYIIGDVPLTHPYRIIQVGVIAVASVGLFTSRPRAHIWISGAYMTTMLVGQFLYRMGPKLAS